MTFTNGKFFTSADRVQLDPDPFCQTLPFMYLYINNSTWQNMAHCPRLHWYTNIRGLRRNGDAEGVHVIFGSLIHEGADVYSKAVAAGANTEQATEFALDHVLKASWPEEQERDVFGGYYGEVWQCTDRTPTRTNKKHPEKSTLRCPWSKAEHLRDGDIVVHPRTGAGTIGYTVDECLEKGICPECGRSIVKRIAYLCSEKIKNRRTLARTIVTLCDHMTAGSIKPRVLPDGRIGSEYRWFQQLAIPSPDSGGVDNAGRPRPITPYHMTGSFDGVAKAPGTLTVLPEYKTTQREPDVKFWTSYEMSPQVHTYTWSGQKEFGPGTRVVLYAIHVGVGFTQIYQKTVYLSPGLLQEWERDLAYKIQEFELRARLAQEMEARGEDPAEAYPRNLTACHSTPGASTTPCAFRDYCRLHPADREVFLAGNFVVKHYNPLGAKGTVTELVVEEAG